MEVKGIISLHLQMEQLHEKVKHLVVLGLTTDMLLDTSFISRYTRRFLPKAGSKNTKNLSSVAIAEAAEESPAMAVEIEDHGEPVEAPSVMSPLVRLSLVSKTLVWLRKSDGGTQLVQTQESLARKLQKLVVRGTLDTAPEILCNNKTASFSNSYLQLH